jgi:RimJ/RimL family protein N-acetyltransferase
MTDMSAGIIDITLVRASRADAYALWVWANDEASRAASGSRPPIPWEEHDAWCTRVLQDPSHRVFIGRLNRSRPIGTVRFDSQDNWGSARLSYVVAPEARGHGWGKRLIELGLAELSVKTRVWGDVLPTNAPSLAIFRALGWDETVRGDEVCRFWANGTKEGV